MRRLLVTLTPALHLTRVTTAFAAVANVWFVILWTRAVGNEPGTEALRSLPLWAALAASACNALGLFAYAVALNDVFDFRRDRALHPERPLPSGTISLDAAVAILIGTFLLAVAGATALGMGAVALTLAVAGAALFYNAAGKFVPAVGLVALGLIYAGQMVIPNLELRFVWPVWLVMTHALAAAWMTHRIGRKIPAISRRAVVAAVCGWVFWSGVMVWAGWSRNEGSLWPRWVSPWSAVGPLLLAAGFGVLAARRVMRLGVGPRAAEKVSRYGALWLPLYGCGWLVGIGAWGSGAVLGGLALAGYLGMTVLREIYSLVEQPLGYRR